MGDGGSTYLVYIWANLGGRGAARPHDDLVLPRILDHVVDGHGEVLETRHHGLEVRLVRGVVHGRAAEGFWIEEASGKH